jgi:hypothetical protein
MTRYEPLGQRPAHEDEIRQTELKLGSYENREESSPWETSARDPSYGRVARDPFQEMTVSSPVYVTHIRLVGGEGHEHISEVIWRKRREFRQSTREAMVEWIRDESGDARVISGPYELSVGVVDAEPPYIRAYTEGVRGVQGVWTDDLLALPRF